MKKAGYLIICLVLTLLLSCAAAAAETKKSLDNFTEKRTYTQGMFGDVSAEAWYASYVGEAYKLDLMNGSGKTTFNPSGNITIAETVAIAARLNKIYNGDSSAFKQGEPWYQVYVDYAIEKEIIGACEYFNYTEKATRADFVSILARALPSEAFENINSLEDGAIPDINSSMRFCDAAYLLYNAGILSGSDKYGTFKPGTNILRSEVATIISRVAKRDGRVKVTLEDLPECPVDGTENVKSVSVSEKMVYVQVGQPYQLNAYTDPWLRNPDLKWTALDVDEEDKDSVSLTADGFLTVNKKVGPFIVVVEAGNHRDVCTVVVADKSYEELKNEKQLVYSNTPSIPSLENLDSSIAAVLYIDGTALLNSIYDNEISYENMVFSDVYQLTYMFPTFSATRIAAEKYAEYLAENDFKLLIKSAGPYGSVVLTDKSNNYLISISMTSSSLDLDYNEDGIMLYSTNLLHIFVLKCKPDYRPEPITGVELSDEVITVTKGETYPLITTLSPSDDLYAYCPMYYDEFYEVTFTSSDPNIVDVSQPSTTDITSICIISAISPGKAVITAETSNGFTAKCTVTVEDNDIEIDNDKTIPEMIMLAESELHPTLNAKEIYNKCAPAVFYMETYDPYEESWYSGSGFFISPSGLAVTCNHIVDDALEIDVYLEDESYYTASVVWRNEDLDLAVIKVNGNNFPFLKMTNQVFSGGERIYTIGYPLGLSSSISEGLVSNGKLSFGDDYIFAQISASISPGSSGGVLLNDKGEAVCVTIGSYTEGQNVNVASYLYWIQLYALTGII